MSIVVTQCKDPKSPERPREYAVYNGLILNWQVRAIEELARQLGTYEDEIVMTALSLFLALHSDRIDLREAALFAQEAPGKIARVMQRGKTCKLRREGVTHERAF